MPTTPPPPPSGRRRLRVLGTAVPATTHVSRTVDTVAEFARQGAEVLFCTSRLYLSKPHQAGLPTRVTGVDDFPKATAPQSKQHDEDWHSNALAQSLADVSRVIDEFKPDLIIRDASERGTQLAAELRGIPCLTVGCTSTSALIRAIEADGWLNRARERVGLAPVTSSAELTPLANLGFRPAVFHGAQDGLIGSNWFLQQENRTAPADSLEQLSRFTPGLPRVLVGLGTALPERGSDYGTRTFEALAQTPVSLLGIGLGPSVLSHSSSQVNLPGLAPQQELLAHVDLFICHAGMNSVVEGLAAGTPMVLIPATTDMFYTTRRCQALGVAASPQDWMVSSTHPAINWDRLPELVERMAQPGPHRQAAAELAVANQQTPTLAESIDPLLALANL